MKDIQLTLGSLFDGIGGFPYAASFYGIRALWASEILPECVSVTKRHFPDMEHVGDVTKLDGHTLPPVDVITFGSPCQDLSVASGKRLGLAGARSGLFLEAVRIIRETREATNGEYPKFALWENVPGALSSSSRRDFKAVLEAFTKTEIPMPGSGQWANAGMVRGNRVDLAWCVYDAQHFGTAQRRRRLFLVCDFRTRRAGEILFVPKSLQGYFEAGGTPRQGLAAYAQGSVGAEGAGIEVLNDQGGDFLSVEQGGVSPTLRSQTHGNLPITAYSIQGSMIGRADGSELDFRVVSAGFKYKASSQSGSVGYQEETAPTLMAGQQSGVMKAYVVGAYHSGGMLSDNPKSGFYEADASRTLDLNRGRPDCQQGGLVIVESAEAQAFAVDCRNLRETDEISGTLQAKADSGGYSLNCQNPVRVGLCVRRLTPTEAERLQGYPDGWTEYGADGKLISDTKRYQMLGNSVCLNIVVMVMCGIKWAADQEM